MAYTSSALEEQLKKEYVATGLPWRLLISSSVIFGLSFLVYAGIVFGQQPYLEKQIQSLKQEIAKLNLTVDESKQKQLIRFYSQFINIQDLIKDHRQTSQIFGFFENNTFPKVKFENMTVNFAEEDISVSGSAPDYETLLKQLAWFNKSPEVAEVNLGGTSGGESIKGDAEIKFTMKIKLSSQAFKF